MQEETLHAPTPAVQFMSPPFMAEGQKVSHFGLKLSPMVIARAWQQLSLLYAHSPIWHSMTFGISISVPAFLIYAFIKSVLENTTAEYNRDGILGISGFDLFF